MNLKINRLVPCFIDFKMTQNLSLSLSCRSSLFLSLSRSLSFVACFHLFNSVKFFGSGFCCREINFETWTILSLMTITAEPFLSRSLFLSLSLSLFSSATSFLVDGKSIASQYIIIIFIHSINVIFGDE